MTLRLLAIRGAVALGALFSHHAPALAWQDHDTAGFAVIRGDDLSYCSIFATYTDNVTLYLLHRRDDDYIFGVSNEHWNIPSGNTHSVDVQFDHGRVASYRARTTDIGFSFGVSRDFVRKWKHSNSISLNTANWTGKYTLSGTYAATTDMDKNCHPTLDPLNPFVEETNPFNSQNTLSEPVGELAIPLVNSHVGLLPQLFNRTSYNYDQLRRDRKALLFSIAGPDHIPIILGTLVVEDISSIGNIRDALALLDIAEAAGTLKPDAFGCRPVGAILAEESNHAYTAIRSISHCTHASLSRKATIMVEDVRQSTLHTYSFRFRNQNQEDSRRFLSGLWEELIAHLLARRS